ncbi:SERPINE1 mRNA-binding protein 1-like isoform X2 [Dysidea avara]|uniref:SERPINE1 mRNA-binding protein 1-like isoform X2 n=1 Tax=Dysidea avara TaxID=196820 RepID=UPI003316E1C8
MESQYSVGVSNRFSLFYEDDDNPGDVVVAPKDKKDKLVKEEKKTTTAPPKAKDNIKDKPLQDTTQSSNKRQGSQDTGTKGGERGRFPRGEDKGRRDGQNARDGQTQKGGRFGDQRRNRPPPRDRDKDEVFQSNTVGSRDDKPNTFREGRINSRGSGRGRGRGGAFRGKREFDRRSGSDRSSIKAVEKREGSGGYNWGTVHDDLNAISPDEEWPSEERDTITNGVVETTTAEPTDSEKPASSQQQDNGTAEQKETNNNGTEEEVPSVVEMTLDEYKAKMYGNRAKPQYQERVVEKGLGDQWKDSVVFERSEDEYIPSQREVIEKIKTSGRKVTPVEVSIHFKDPARRGRGRTAGRSNEDRRSSGGRRDRAPNMTDPKDFPAL